jgi:hypothetical protein
VAAIALGTTASVLPHVTGVHPRVAELLPTLAGGFGPVLDSTNR